MSYDFLETCSSEPDGLKTRGLAALKALEVATKNLDEELVTFFRRHIDDVSFGLKILREEGLMSDDDYRDAKMALNQIEILYETVNLAREFVRTVK